MDLPAINHLSLCAGGAGLDLAIRLALPALRTVCYVEIEASAGGRLVENMQAGALDEAPLWTDLKTFNGKPWRGTVDILSGGYPCQPFSVAGRRRGTDDPRHLWPSVARIVSEIRPPLCFFENVPGHIRLGFGEVRRTLETLGYRVEAGIFSAEEVGAPHRRERLFILAHCDSEQIERFDEKGLLDKSRREGNRVEVAVGPRRRRREPGLQSPDSCEVQAEGSGDKLANTQSERCGETRELRRNEQKEWISGPGEGQAFPESKRLQIRWFKSGEKTPFSKSELHERKLADTQRERLEGFSSRIPSGASELAPRSFPPPPNDADAWREVLQIDPSLEPAICGVDDGMAYRVDRLRICGNGVVPVVGALAFLSLWSRFK